MGGLRGPVLLLHQSVDAQARPDEADVLVQVQQLARALAKAGLPVTVLATGPDLDATLGEIMRRAPACVFNLVESLDGCDRLAHLVPAALQAAGVPFTGNGSAAIHLSTDKLLAKRCMRQNGIRTPDWLEAGRAASGGAESWIVKSVTEHASLGLDEGCVVRSVEDAWRRIRMCEQRHGGEWFAERFVAGREFNISVLECHEGPRVLPLAEMTFRNYPAGKPRIVSYAAKWDERAPEYHATRRVFPALAPAQQERLAGLARRCWRAFGLRGYARVDLRVDDRGIPWVLEVNANPCLARDAGLAAAARRAGMGYGQLAVQIVDAAAPPGGSAIGGMSTAAR